MPDLSLRLHKDMLVVAPLLTAALFGADIDEDECLEYLNILDDDLVRDTHLRFKAAGAHCAPTNTLHANRLALGKWGLEAALTDINRAGVRLAREAGMEHVLAAVSVLEPEPLREQLEALLWESPDAVMLVGSASDKRLPAAIAAIQSQTSLPVIVPALLKSDNEDAATNKDAREGVAVNADEDEGASASLSASLSANLNASEDALLEEGTVICLVDDRGFEESLKALAELAHTKHPNKASLMVCPHVNVPETSNDRQRSQALNAAADELFEFALRAREAGAQFVGTAAGSSPVFTGAIYAAIAGLDTL